MIDGTPVEAITAEGHQDMVRLDAIRIGDLVKGRYVATGEARFRRVINVSRNVCTDWYIVAARILLPSDRVWCEDRLVWTPSHEIGEKLFGHFGHNISIEVEASADDDRNFILVGLPKHDIPDLLVSNV